MKYIIEIEDEPFGRNDDPVIPHGMDELYRAKGFNSLVFDKNGLDKLTPLDKALSSELGEAYHKGMEEGKKQAKVQAHLDVCHDIERVAHGNYQKGLDDAWECARRLVWETSLKEAEHMGFIVTEDTAKILRDYTVTAAMKAVELYDEKQLKAEIKVGDEIKNKLDFMDNAVGYFFGDSSDGCYKVLRYVDGKFKTGIWNKENCERTGKHSYAVERMVAVMKEGAE